MERSISLDRKPVRVVSLVPSITEYLVDLGTQVVGRTRFCIHPSDQVANIPIIGGTKHFDFERIREISPDLIVGNKEENYQEGIEVLEKEFPVWMSQVITIPDALNMMISLGDVLELNGEKWTRKVQEKLDLHRDSVTGSVVYMIWRRPWMVAGQDTFIDSYLRHLGYTNVVTRPRYPSFSEKELAQFYPEKVLLSSEPYPFSEKHLEEIRNIFPEAQVELVNGESYSWYGTRLLKS